MARKVDPEVLAGFLEEARSYLPQILRGLEEYCADPSRVGVLAEAHRMAHALKGSAAMVGLSSLSHIAYHLEEALEDVAEARLRLEEPAAALLRRTVTILETYLDGLQGGSLREQPLLDEVRRSYQQLRGLPVEEPAPSPPEPAAEVAPPAMQASPHEKPAAIWLPPETGDDSSSTAEPPPVEDAPVAEEEEPLRDVWIPLGTQQEPQPGEAEASAASATAGAAEELSPELFDAFVLEAEEHLHRLSTQLGTLQRQPDDRDLLQEIRRSAHALKGGAAVVSFRPVIELAHSMEDLLDALFAGATPVVPDIVAALFATHDALEDLVAGKGDDQASHDLLARHAQILDQVSATAPIPSPQPAEADEEDVALENLAAELLEVFALEADDHLRTITTSLATLRQQPSNKEVVQDIRRSAHTLKGTAAMVGYRRVTKLAHRMEDLLDLLYERDAAVGPEETALLFASADALEDLVAGKAASLRDLYARYDELLGRRASVAPASKPAAEAAPAEQTEAPEEAAAARGLPARQTGQHVRVPIERLDELVKLVSELVITRAAFEQRTSGFAHQLQELHLSTERMRRVTAKLETRYAVSALGRTRLAAVGAAGGDGGSYTPATNFSAHGFDDLEFDRYTEFHLLSRELAETSTDLQTVGGEMDALNGEFDGYLNRQSRLTSEIQDKLMRVRMVPLANLASRLHRTVRNVANQQGKQAELILEGEEIELDKTVLEEMADPLLHLLRNAVDHGIESPAVRQSRGKPPQGTVRVRASYEGTQVVIELRDDGGGIDPERVRATAVNNGLIAAAAAAALPDEEVFDFIFRPGFSTASEVSEVSGRGVGLDIVKSKVHKLKGTVNLVSEPGAGTTFTVRLPMTLAITRSLLVRAAGQTFALPLAAVTQILRLEEQDTGHIGREPVVRVGGKVYPCVSLARVLNLKQAHEETVRRPPVVLLNVGDREVALVVDHLLGGREIVVKNLGTHVRHLPGVTGATFMGDGTVVLILNPTDLVAGPVRARAPTRAPQAPPAARPRRSLTVMVTDDSPSVRRVVTTLLKGAGWTALPAKDGLEALEILHHASPLPDVMLLDIEMPRMDGYELLATLKGQAAYRDIPVVMVTSRAGEKHRRKAIDLGAAAYVVKPYQDEELLATIRTLAEARSASAPV